MTHALCFSRQQRAVGTARGPEGRDTIVLESAMQGQRSWLLLLLLLACSIVWLQRVQCLPGPIGSYAGW